MRFLLKKREAHFRVIYIYSAKAQLNKTVLRQRLKAVVVDRWSLMSVGRLDSVGRGVIILFLSADLHRNHIKWTSAWKTRANIALEGVTGVKVTDRGRHVPFVDLGRRSAKLLIKMLQLSQRRDVVDIRQLLLHTTDVLLTTEICHEILK